MLPRLVNVSRLSTLHLRSTGRRVSAAGHRNYNLFFCRPYSGFKRHEHCQKSKSNYLMPSLQRASGQLSPPSIARRQFMTSNLKPPGHTQQLRVIIYVISTVLLFCVGVVGWDLLVNPSSLNIMNLSYSKILN